MVSFRTQFSNFPKSDEKTRKHWSTLLIKDVESKLKSKTSFACLTKDEINVICRGLKSVLPTTLPDMKVSWKFLELLYDLMTLVKNNINVNPNKIMSNL